MEATLTNTEMESIAKIVSEKLHAQFIADGSQKQIQEASEKYTKQMIQFYLSENAVSYDVAKMLKPIFDEHLKNTNLISDKLNEYMNTDHFKKLELQHLERRVEHLRKELYNNFED